jgi:3-phenylpropionate/cinnamic acid dioxygenase small subunit
MSNGDRWPGVNDRMEVEQRIAEQFAAVDGGQATQSLALCSDDFSLMVAGRTMDRSQYEEFMAKREAASYQTRHCFTNVRLTEGTENEMHVAFTVTSHRLEEGADSPSVNVGDFVDSWSRSENGWLLRNRSIAPAFV